MAKNKSAKIRSVQERKVSSASQPALRDQPSQNSRRNLILICILLFGLVVAVFLPAIRNDFFYWYGDDTGYVTENAHVQSGLTWESVKWAFGNIERDNWFPLTWLSHMLDCQIYGLKPWGHHLTSVLWHAVNTVLLFVVLRRMTGAMWRSLVVALLFGLHPLRVDSVAWVAERKDVLCTFFWMLSLLMYARYAEEFNAQNPKTKKFYALTLLCFIGGLMSKAMIVTLPFVLLLLDYWPLQRWQRKNIWRLVLEKIPFLALGTMLSLITFVAQKKGGFVETMDAYPISIRLGNALVSYVRYLGQMFWPIDLVSFYPHPGRWPTITLVAAIILLLAISIFAFATRRRWPYVAVGWCWFLGVLVPVIGLVQLGGQAMANRFSYVPMIGILLLTVWGVHDLTKRWRYQKEVLSGVAIAFLAFCIVITRQQIGYYKDGVTAWRHNFEVTGNIDVAQYALGLSLARQGREEEGITQLQAVVKHSPERAEVHFNLGNMFNRQGRVDESIRHYREALRFVDNSEARFNLGMQLYKKGRMPEAIRQLEKAMKLNNETQFHSNDAKIFDWLGNMLVESKRLDEAIFYFKELLKLTPNDLNTRLNLATALADTGRQDEAIQQFQEILKLDPNSTVARAYLDSVTETKKGASP